MSTQFKEMALPSRAARSKKRGFTLTEIAIVLGIMGLILGSVWSAASSVYENMKITDAINGIVQASNTIRGQFSNSMTTGVSGANITTAGVFPVSWKTTTAGVYGNPWNRNATASKAQVYGSATAFTVHLSNITDAGCAAIMNNFTGAASNASGGLVMGLIGTYVGTSVANTIYTTYAAQTSCTNGNTGNFVGVSFDLTKM
jgi:prepilin-type N-terminal cleavage/methylation domain-containing protein